MLLLPRLSSTTTTPTLLFAWVKFSNQTILFCNNGSLHFSCELTVPKISQRHNFILHNLVHFSRRTLLQHTNFNIRKLWDHSYYITYQNVVVNIKKCAANGISESSSMAGFLRKIYLTGLSGSFPFWMSSSLLTVCNKKTVCKFTLLNKLWYNQ